MLRLVRNEISYIKYVLLGISVLFIAISIFMRLKGRGPEHMMIVEQAELIFIVIAFFLMYLIFMGIEVSEKRLRMLATIPIAIWRTGMYRIITPVVLLVIFKALAIVTILILPMEVLRHIGMQYQEDRVWVLFSIYYIASLCLLSTAMLRLLVEFKGRILLAGIIGVAALFLILVPDMNPAVAEAILEVIYYPLNSPAGPLLVTVMAVGFMALLEVYYIQRTQWMK